MRPRTSALLVLLALPAAADDDWCSRANFDTLDAGFRKSVTARADDGATLAWGRSYALMAYVSMYRATKDVAYVRHVLEEGEAIAALRDDRRDLRDVVRDRVMPAWSTARYEGKRQVWAVHTGMITAPILEALWLLRDTKGADVIFPPKRRDALRVAMREAVDAHAAQWRDGPAKGEGRLEFVGRRIGLPFNQQNALGRSYVWLHRLTDDKNYEGRAKALLAFFKNRLRRSGDGYVWSYFAPLNGHGKGFEDLSHAAISVDFACLGASRGWGFDKHDMARLRRTLLGKVMKTAHPADTVGGTHTTGKYARQAGRWLALADGDPEVWERVHAYFDRNRPTTQASDLLILAQLLRHRPR